MRRVTVIALGALGLAMRATAPAAQPATAPTAQISREDIEWLDICCRTRTIISCHACS
jgi:hypothetical protein